ncbi:hypothetical protein [Staphylococcus phage PT94]
MIHVLDFEGKIIDYIDQDDLAVYKVLHKRSTETETLDIEIDNERAEHFKRRHRVIIKDKTDKYREFIIDRATEESGAVIVEATASHLVDLKNAKPLQKGSFKNMGVNQKVSEILRDSGWEVNNSVFAGITNTTWDKTIYANDLLIQIAEEHKVNYEFEVVIDGYEVTKRYVNIEEPVHLFQGREIVYGKDLESMKRSIDFSEVRTALYIVGPEEEKKPSKVTTVIDDKAQEQFGDSYHYIWDIFEPSDNVTADTSVDELKRLGKQELAKRNSAALSYEINIVDLEQEFPHEVINFGDIVRIKNPDFVPSLYAESEVIGIEYELISGECNYTFGNIVERKEDELLKYFRDRIFYINQKLNDGLTNVNTIVKDAVDNELQYFEKKIFKGTEPPENPVNDILWLDTSNPNVSVLRRYWNGEWINSTAENANDVGAVTREQALYSELTNTFVNLSIQHSKLLNEMHELTNSEYLVDFDLKEELNNKLDDTITVYDNIKNNLDSMTSETATIGKLVDTQALFLSYREKLQALYNVVENAKLSIDERFKLLQSQYTDEKFNEAMKRVAETFGIKQDESGRFIGPPETIAEMVDALRTETKEEMSTLLKRAEYETDKNGIVERLNASDSERKQLSNEINDRVTITEYNTGMEEKTNEINTAVNNIKIGGVNLFQSYDSVTHGNNVHPSITSTQSFRGKYWATTLYTADYLKKVLVPGEEYTYSYEIEIIGLSEKEVPAVKRHGIIFYSATNTKDNILSYVELEREVGNKYKVSKTFVAPEITDHRFVAYSGFYSDDGTIQYPVSSNLVEIRNLKLEEGNKATDYTEAPEDTTNKIATAQANAEAAAKAYADAQDELKQEEVKAYADGIVSEEEQRAIAEAQQKLEEAKADAQEKANTAESLAKQHADTQSVVAETNAKAYADGLKKQTDQTLTTYDTRITQNGQEISQRATKEEFNASRKTLSHVISELTNSTMNGLTYTYDENGAIQSFNVGPNGVVIDSSKININKGDVIIENGVTSIKNLSADKIRVGFNGISSNLNMTSTGLQTVQNGMVTSILDGTGHHFFNNYKSVGYIGTSRLTDNVQSAGLTFSLIEDGNFVAFTYGEQATSDASKIAMIWSKNIEGYRNGFYYKEDIVIDKSRVLETSYIRPFGNEPKYRLFMGASILNKREGVSIHYNNQNGASVHFSNDAIAIMGTSSSGGLKGIEVTGDTVVSQAIFDRTYSSASNMYITSYGTVGRSTSASKYKLSQEKQFNDTQEQYNHSKNILKLDIKTWYDRFESETYAKEIEEDKRIVDEDFKLKRYVGLIAEDVKSVGLDEFVSYGKDNEIEGIEYDRLWIHLIPVIRQQQEEIENLKKEIGELTNGK